MQTVEKKVRKQIKNAAVVRDGNGVRKQEAELNLMQRWMDLRGKQACYGNGERAAAADEERSPGKHTQTREKWHTEADKHGDHKLYEP